MVTDRSAYIGTSNWSGDYFTNTAGIGLVLHDDDSVPHDQQPNATATTTAATTTSTSTDGSNSALLAAITNRTTTTTSTTPAATTNASANGTATEATAQPEAAGEPVQTLRGDLESVFERDWNSMYALDLAKV